jgi:nucleoside-diphosphate-sugar epimerase
MNIFLTGGTGFVGSHFLAQALAQGHHIKALRRPGSQPRLPLAQQPQWIDGALDGDYSAELQGVDVLVHLASHTPNPPYDTLDKCLYWNVFAAAQLARQATEQGVRQMIVAGSCFEYGRSAERVPFIEVDTPLEPALSYPTSKAAASVAFLGLARELNLQLKLMRIFQVYGEGEQATRLWPSLRAAAQEGRDFPMSAGEQVRDFIAVEEVARQFVQALDFSDVAPGQPQVSHVATGQPQTLLAFAQHWWQHWGGTGKLIPGAVPYRHNEVMRIATRAQGLYPLSHGGNIAHLALQQNTP